MSPFDRRYNLPNETKNCEYCGKSFGPSKYDYSSRWKRRRFCSLRCIGLASVKGRTYLRARSCLYCGETFQPRENKYKYCSIQCYWASKMGKPGYIPEGSRITISCLWCKKEFNVIKFEAEKLKRKFCSCECYYAFVKVQRPDTLIYRNGINEFYLSKAWGKLKRFVRKRDNYTCQMCGKKFAAKGPGLCVHHIKSRNDFDGITSDVHSIADHLDNLVALCTSCHGKVHSGTQLSLLF